MPSAFSDPQPTAAVGETLVPAALLRLPFVQTVRRGLERAGASKKILAAVSGGPDSSAMLVALWALREPLGLELFVCSIDHGLRSESLCEAQTVCAVAQRLGLSAEIVRVTVPKSASKMSAARTARYQALGEVCAARGISTIAVAHTRNDQSETLLQRFLGGAGLRGLSGMALRAPLPVGKPLQAEIVRPLLSLSRGEVGEFVARVAPLLSPLPFLDPTNADLRYQRSRLRQDVLPILRRESPRLDQHLSELSAQLAADADYLDQVAAETFSALRLPEESAALVCLSRGAISSLPRAISARVLILAAGRSLSRRHVDALLSLCGSGAGTQSLALPGGIVAERRYEELRFGRAGPARGDAEAGAWPLALTAGIQRCGGISLRIEVPFAGTPSAEDGKGRHAICIPRPDEPLFLRAPRTGDRIRLPSGTRKLSDLLTDRKVPRPERAKVRVLCAGEAIVWVIGYGAAVISDGESGTALGSRPLVRISVAADHEQDLVGG